MTMSFENWTSYDDWLIVNYDNFAITKVSEIDGKICIEYCDKAEWIEKKNSEKK